MARGPLRRAFPFTARGLVVLAAAGALCAAGVLRADLAALFWGASFLLYCLYVLACGHLFRLALLRRRAASPGFLSLTLPVGSVTAGERAEALAAARLPRAFPPGFSVIATIPLEWRARTLDGARVRLPGGESRRLAAFTARARGVYRSSAALLEARDLLGLTAHALLVPQEESLTVLPRARPRETRPPLAEQAEDSVVYARSRRRSESLLEARKYYPGDDVRRLNWKLFAHLDELYLRVGEEVPPPEARVLLALDTAASPLVPRGCAEAHLDALVESCAGIAAGLVERGVEASLCLPGVPGCRAFTAETLPALLALLADAWWARAPWIPELPSMPMHAVAVSTPGSPGLAPILAAVRARGWRSSVLLQDLPPARPRWPRGVRDILFLPRTPAPTGPTRRERAAYTQAMERELALHDERGSGALHAADA
jgi:uncharacterized protein (DUF58 family)